MTVVTFLTDFGTSDGFAAAMKGVVLGIAPDVRLVEATHDIAPGDVEAGAWVLCQFWSLYPSGTVHVAVVDPGVGSSRKALAVQADDRVIVAPDNGLVTRVLESASHWRCVEIREARFFRPVISATFHGRDIFAPVAAHLAAGISLEELGPPLEKPVMMQIEPPTRSEREVRGRVVHIDKFGNVITDIPADWIDERYRFAIGERRVGPLSSSYSDAGIGELVAVIGSAGTVEIAARGAAAAEKTGAARGDPVVGTRKHV
jgi:S-adenosylmethionine hydrolase